MSRNHHDKYLSFEYDNGGWNNVRMSLECLLVVAHAMGRTLVVPPQQHLYLLGNTHKDKHDTSAHDEMGFEDFFDLELLKSQLGRYLQLFSYLVVLLDLRSMTLYIYLQIYSYFLNIFIFMSGFHMMSMEEFLAKEGATGGLNPSRLLLPKNDTKLWGRDLWFYLNKVADLTPCKIYLLACLL